MGHVKKCLSCRKLFNKSKTLVLPSKYLFSLVSLVENKIENFHILKYMLQIQCKYHWLLPGGCAQNYKRTKLYNTLLIFKTYAMKQNDLSQPWIILSYCRLFFDWKPIRRPTAHIMMSLFIQTLRYIFGLFNAICMSYLFLQPCTIKDIMNVNNF